MKRKRILVRMLAVGPMLALAASLSLAQGPEPLGPAAPQAAVGTAFTYQGRLTESGSPANGDYQFRFELYDAASGGTLLGTVTTGSIPVADGLFTVQLDFGGDVFYGEARWLEVGVWDDNAGSYVILSPRQELTPAPYALALPGLWAQQNATSPNLIGGYDGNEVAAGSVGATIGGGGASGFPNRVTDDWGTVGGGYKNQAGDDAGASDGAAYATVAGGHGNTANGNHATVGGGAYNWATSESATVNGGYSNVASKRRATVGGGINNHAGGVHSTVGGGDSNIASHDRATIGGGRYNQALANYATIAGGGSDTVGQGNRVTDEWGTVGGGSDNQAGDGDEDTTDAPYTTVGGGEGNTASGKYATVAGGSGNAASGNLYATVSGGRLNSATDNAATVGGGFSNVASGNRATVPGGEYNTAQGAYSFAAGQRAQANNIGCFVWGDSATADNVECNDDNRWVARTSGGVWFYTRADLGTGAHLAANSGTWSALSDRNVKENVETVDAKSVLERLAGIPVSTWNYIGAEEGVQHMGPMAQDFYAAFSLGDSERHITTIDADGVALAAIQGLYERAQEQAACIEELKAENAALEVRLSALEKRVKASGSPPSGLTGGGRFDQILVEHMPGWVLLGGLTLVAGVVIPRRRAGGEG